MFGFESARAMIGKSKPAGFSGGRSRYIAFEARGDNVAARMFDTDVVLFTPDYVEIRTGGHITPSTFDGIAAALNIPRFGVGTIARVPYVAGHRLTEGMRLDYHGIRLFDPEWATWSTCSNCGERVVDDDDFATWYHLDTMEPWCGPVVDVHAGLDPQAEPAVDWLNHELSHLADARGAALHVADVGQDDDGYRVTVVDWTYDGRDHSATARKLAAAYVGTPGARTSILSSQTDSLTILVRTVTR